MLEINTLTIKNFWSYGDHKTTIKLDDLGPCLITGEVNDGFDEETDLRKTSNGAGKSALVESILWCLFGRTMRIPNPGDKVINFFTKKDCVVELTFKNGDKLRRTRNVDGHNDLLFIKDGEDISLGTSKMEQERLNKILGLDFDIFTGSTFFSQFGRSWMEISDQKRKEALEREFRLDRIQTYASVAKSRLDKAKQEQDRINSQLDNLGDKLSYAKSQITKFKESSDKFDEQKRERLKHTQQLIEEAIKSRDAIELADVDAIKSKWDLYKRIVEKINEKQSSIYNLERQQRKLEGDADHQESLIKKWKGKGEICGSCEQLISQDHIAEKLNTPRIRLKEIKQQINNLTSKINDMQQLINKARKSAESRKPNITVAQAQATYKDRERYEKQIRAYEKTAEKIASEENQYDGTVRELRFKTKELEKQIEEIKKRLAKFDKLIIHLNYIYRAYHDRRKIKSYLLSEYIPYLNSRINYYLSKFGLDLNIEFTNALGIKTDTWGYQQFSGGECKRFDVAMMLAMFDLHALMYGRHCNLIVFDEVDGRLDVSGAEIFADIIRSDFIDKVDSILVISQRIDMRGSLSSEIKVAREDRFSRIAEITK